MMFTSTTRESIIYCQRHDAWDLSSQMCSCNLRAPVNPILVALRTEIADDPSHDQAFWVREYDFHIRYERDARWLPEHIEHARKVLTRLAALATLPEPERDLHPEFDDAAEQRADDARYTARYE